MSETNNEIKIGSIPTINGILDKQGYIVYSISSVCVCHEQYRRFR